MQPWRYFNALFPGIKMLEVKSMGNFHLVLYEINMGCVCVCGAWPAW